METDRTSRPRPAIWFGVIGAFLTAANNTVAILALGVLQGPIVAFTTPFAFALARLMFPRLPAATLVYLPVVAVSIFTVNFGPPGPHKVLFMLGAVAYDLACYVTGVGIRSGTPVAAWKLIVATIFYPFGLLAGALLALRWVTVEIPILSRGWIGVAGMFAAFLIVGSLATLTCHRIYYKWIIRGSRR
jgi:hypothetical protein